VKLVKELSSEQFDSLAIGLIKATHNTIDDLEVIEIDHGDDNIHANTVVCLFFLSLLLSSVPSAFKND
jgi:hypothetical protein